MDIADFNLEAFIAEKKLDPKFICIAKHLCGGATDLSLCSMILR